MAHSFIKGSDHSDKSDFYGSNVVISSRSDFKYWFVQGNSKGDYPYLMFAVGNYEYKKRGVYVLENNNSLLGKIPASPFDGIPYTNIGWNPVKSIWIEVKGVSSSTKSASYSGEMSSLKMSSVPHDIKGTGVGSGYKSPFASFTYSPANPAVGEQVTFDASASSDSDGTVDKYEWDFGDSSTATGKTAYHSYSAAGTYTVKLTVTDNSNLTNSTQKTITITSANQSPVAAFTYSPENPKAGEKVTFDASSSSDSDGTIESYEWDFGNKSTGKGQKVYNTFTQNGDYSITLTVKDNSGATGTKTASLSVSPKGDSRGGKPKDPNSLQGDPVNIINGNMLMIKDDFSNPSPGMPFEFVRAYNSMIETDSPLGAGWTHNYNITLTPPADSASSAVIKDTDGKIIIFYQNSPGQFKPESGEYSTLSKKDSNYVWQKKDKIKYTFNSNGKLQPISDRNNNAVSITYDDNERLKTLTDTAGRNYSITCDDNNHITKVTNPAGKTVSYTYDSDGNLTKVTNTVGVVTQYEYNDTNDKHNITKQTVGNKFVYTYSYDEQDHCVSAKGPNGEIGYSFDYKFTGGNTAMPDSRGNTTTKYHNDSGKVSKIEYPDSTQEVFSWDGNLNKTSETLQDNSTWSYEYDGNGNITKAVDALGNSKIMSYDENDNLVSLIDELSRTTKYTYDGNGNLTRITLPDNTETNFTYNSRGQPLTIADSSGKTTTFAYDSQGNLTSVTDPEGNKVSYAYDSLGRRTKVTDARGKVTQYEYDALNRVTKITDAQSGEINTSYEVAGLGSLKDQNSNTTTFLYDSLDQLTSVTDPLGKTKQFSYDATGNLSSRTDFNGNTTNYTYDAMNRLTTIKYPDSSQVAYTYDSMGRMTQATKNYTDTFTYAYDTLGRVTSYTNNRGLSVSYAYDKNGNLTSLTYPGSKTITYEYDNQNRLTQVKDWAGRKTSYSYDQRGLLTQATLPNGTKAQYAYDNAGRMTSLKNVKSDNTVIASYSYTLDSNGNIASETADQPISRSVKAQTVSYTYGSDNRLSSANSTSFTYDDNGNISAKGSNSFQYDYENCLKKVTTSQGTWEYEYDGVGNRIEIKNGSDTRRFLVDQTGMTQALAEYDGNGNLIAYYIYGLGLIYKVDASGNPYYYHYDFTGNTVAMTDSSGSIVNKYAYTPFGTLVGSKETVSNPFRYVGKYGVMDDNNGLFYMRARYYDAETGRFITKDPIGFAGGVNLYAYVKNNPMKWIDPTGTCIKTDESLSWLDLIRQRWNKLRMDELIISWMEKEKLRELGNLPRFNYNDYEPKRIVLEFVADVSNWQLPDGW